MRLKLYQSSTIFNSAKFMLSKIDNSDFMIDNIIVVPDKYSLLTEKMVLDLSNGGSLFNIRVKTLSSLANELMQKLGLGRCEVISSGESLLITQMAIENVKKDFIVFKKSNINFCYEINKIISQFKSSCIDGESLNSSAEGVTGHKYHDLTLIYNEYQRLLSGSLDANERLKLIKNKLEQSDVLKHTRIYFAHYDAFTKEAFEFVSVLLKCCDLVGFALAYPNFVGNEYMYEKDIQEKLKKIISTCGGEIEVINEDESLSLQQKAIIRGLYSYEKVQAQNDGYYNIYGGGSLSAEIEAVAKLIRYMTYKGRKYRDFQIALGNLEGYKNTLEDVFSRYDIPYYLDSSITADQTILGNFILEFLNTFVTGFSKDNLIDFFSNILVKEKSLAFQCKVYEVEGRAKYKQYIEKDNPFANEFASLEKAKSVQDISKVIGQVCDKVKEKYNLVLEKLKEDGDVKHYKINSQVEEIVKECTLLIDKYSLDESDCAEYLKKLKLLLSFKQVSTVPTYLDSVLIGEASSSGFEESPFLIVMGAEHLPQTSADIGLLSDDELKMNGLDNEIEPTIRMINRRNRFKLFNLISLASERLFVFYQISNREGKKNELPAYVKSLNNIFSQQPRNVRGVFFTKDAKGEGALLASELKEKDLSFDYLSRNPKIVNADKLLLGGDRVKVTQLESYFVCPFRHFANYGLKLKEVIRHFDPRDLGNVCHKMAEMFVEQKIMNGERETCNVNKFVEDNFDYVLQSEGAKEKIEYLEEKDSLLGFLKKQMISLLNDIVFENKKSEFKPKYIEVGFDNLSLGKYKLIGKADRIDEYNEYLRIIDYKTGKTSSLLKGLYYGEKLQLFLYQKVAGEKYNKKEGGVFYFNAKFSYSKGEERESILKGIVDNDEKLINALDSDIDLYGKSSIIPIRKEEKGYKGASISTYQLKELAQYAFKVGEKAVGEIEKGYIQPKPTESGCDWCPFGSLCQYERQKGVRANKEDPKF